MTDQQTAFDDFKKVFRGNCIRCGHAIEIPYIVIKNLHRYILSPRNKK